MRTRLFTLLVVVVATTWFICSTTKAEILVQHLGSTDPETEGWALTNTGVDASSIGALTPDTGYEDAWMFNDDSASARAYYLNDLTTTQMETLDWSNVDWQLDARLRVTSYDTMDYRCPTVHFVTPGAYNETGKDFIMDFGADAEGNAIVQLTGLSGTNTITLDSGSYHDYSLRYDASTGTASLYIDGSGTAALSGYTGSTKHSGYSATTSFVRFGSTSTGSIGGANYSLVQFSVVPEPSTAALLGLGVLAFAVSFGWKCRRS